MWTCPKKIKLLLNKIQNQNPLEISCKWCMIMNRLLNMHAMIFKSYSIEKSVRNNPSRIVPRNQSYRNSAVHDVCLQKRYLSNILFPFAVQFVGKRRACVTENGNDILAHLWRSGLLVYFYSCRLLCLHNRLNQIFFIQNLRGDSLVEQIHLTR